jgi:nickel-dependent lactate racemase
MEEAMTAEGKHHAQIQKEMHSMKVVERWFSVPMEQMVGDSASMDNVGYRPGGSPVNMYTQKLDFSKTQVVHAKDIQGGLTDRAAVCG